MDMLSSPLIVTRRRVPDQIHPSLTKCNQNKLEVIRLKLGFFGSFAVEVVGHSGGLAMMWQEEIDITIVNYSRRHIHAEVGSQTEEKKRTITGFYGHPNPAKRHETEIFERSHPRPMDVFRRL